MAQDILSGLVGWWKFDDGSGTGARDSSGTGNTGTLENGPIWKSAAQIGPFSLFFDGSDDQVACGSAASVDNLVSKTIAWWQFISAQGYAMGKTPSDGSTGWLTGPIASGGDFLLRYSHTFSGSNPTWDSATGRILAGKWQHCAVTYNNSSTSNNPLMYVNGTTITVGAPSPAPSGTTTSDAANTLYIGNRAAAPDGVPFAGQIDDIRLYNRILTADDVRFLYDQKFINGSMLLNVGSN